MISAYLFTLTGALDNKRELSTDIKKWNKINNRQSKGNALHSTKIRAETHQIRSRLTCNLLL